MSLMVVIRIIICIIYYSSWLLSFALWLFFIIIIIITIIITINIISGAVMDQWIHSATQSWSPHCEPSGSGSHGSSVFGQGALYSLAIGNIKCRFVFMIGEWLVSSARERSDQAGVGRRWEGNTPLPRGWG